MLATCRAAVAGLITSSSAISRLDRPWAISITISCSRGVSGVGPRCAPPVSCRGPEPASAASRDGSVQAGSAAAAGPGMS